MAISQSASSSPTPRSTSRVMMTGLIGPDLRREDCRSGPSHDDRRTTCLMESCRKTRSSQDGTTSIACRPRSCRPRFCDLPAPHAGLLAAAQAVEHCEISRYGTLKTWAQELGLEQAVRLLDETPAEEKATDAALTELAESEVNLHAEAA